MPIHKRAAAMLNGLLLVTSACAGSTRPSVSDVSLPQVRIMASITTAEFRFEPSELSLRANERVRLVFDNRLQSGNSGGALAHDFTIDNIGGQGLLSRLAGYHVHIPVAADSKATGAFQLPRGTYAFHPASASAPPDWSHRENPDTAAARPRRSRSHGGRC